MTAEQLRNWLNPFRPHAKIEITPDGGAIGCYDEGDFVEIGRGGPPVDTYGEREARDASLRYHESVGGRTLNAREDLAKAAARYRLWDLRVKQRYPDANAERRAAYELWLQAVIRFNSWRQAS